VKQVHRLLLGHGTGDQDGASLNQPLGQPTGIAEEAPAGIAAGAPKGEAITTSGSGDCLF
jgi:hypothetical protein